MTQEKMNLINKNRELYNALNTLRKQLGETCIAIDIHHSNNDVMNWNKDSVGRTVLGDVKTIFVNALNRRISELKNEFEAM